MTENYKKKLIEVAIPLEVINKASAREKSIRHGHPSTLHLWWARRPLAACRAVLFAQLVDDPSSHPDMFPTEEEQETERQRLFEIIEDLIAWENSTNEEVLKRAREEIKKSCNGNLPPAYDPFSGGCSIPLEAQRLGLPAYGSDLNPVAVMIGKSMIEIPPIFNSMEPVNPNGPERNHYRNAEGLAEDVKFYGEWMRNRAYKRIGHLYPQVNLPKENGGGSAPVVAWIWTRTVPSPDPAFSGVHVPIASSFALSTKKGKEAWLEPIVDKANGQISYQIRKGGSKDDLEKAKKGTKAGRGANFFCLLSGTAITPDYVKETGRSGEMGHSLIAIVAEGKGGRIFVESTDAQEQIALSAEPDWSPLTSLPNDPRNFWTVDYGLTTFGDLFTKRQLVTLNTYIELVHEAQKQIEKDAYEKGLSKDSLPLREGGKGAKAYSEAVCVYLGLAIGRLADISNAHCNWSSNATQVVHLFGRQAIPMVWEYAEAGAFAGSAGDIQVSLNSIIKNILRFVPGADGFEIQHDAQSLEYLDGAFVSTDPPYYDNIAYADLSDFFFCWLKPALKDIYPDLFSTIATPKSEELVATPYRHNGKDAAEAFFLNGMRNAIHNMAQQTSTNIPAAIYYAFKQSEISSEGTTSTGWATFLQAVIEAGYSVVGTWPIRTERADRMVASGKNALANSVVLVCRKRKTEAGEITRAEFIRALKKELPPAIHELQKAYITPVDMPQTSIGPGIGIFSRYKAVLESDDSPMSVKTALQIINKELDEFLNEQEGEFDAETRFAVTWFEQNGMGSGSFGDADNLARARGLSVDSVKHAGIVESAAGKVRLLRRDELDEDWSPVEDTHLTVWECTHYLIRALENSGELAAAILIKLMSPDQVDAARDLAYRLFDICDKQGQSKEAGAYNSLIAVWPDLTAQAATISDADLTQEQLSML